MTDVTTKIDINSRRRLAKSSTNQQLMEMGRMPPQAVELEEAVLGALMLERDALTNIIDILKPESFYKDAHNRIFTAIFELFKRSEPVDILTVTQELKKTGQLEIVGGAYYITQLTNRVASAANAEFHARIVAQKHIQRELIRISTQTINDAYEESSDVFDLLDNAEKNLFSIVDGSIKKDYDKMYTLINKAIAQIEVAKDKKDGLSGVPSGLTALDRITSGWQKSDLVIIAARPAMGKTALVLTMARNAAVEFKHPVAIFSLEMSSIQLVTRLIASESELSSEKLKKGNLEDYEFQQLNDKTKKLADAPLFIDDTPGLSIFELRAKARRLKEQHKIELIIVDYLQLMTGGGEGKGNREQEIALISRSLKGLAKELEIPVIALSQLSRAVETRGGDKRPQLSDLRESGAIEQDADMVMFIHRPEYYNITEDENGMDSRGMAELIIAKHRNGPIDSAKTRYIGQFTKFTDLDTLDQNLDYGSADAGITPSTDFGNSSGSVIRGSKMNDIEEDHPF
ncbi:MAG: replicative DNA helicase [Bacteroidetes bacterium RIFCSPLOWO2_12_FULL_35_15]|nr:MAG: replicative DNA helicase [Bacteroidetes bacterium RIFCSPLOWO2_12_FULL_35_15]